MPGMSGYEFVKKVKQIKTEVKIILMTAFEINDVELSIHYKATRTYN